MLDKQEQNIITNNFVQKSWKNMSGLLDQEMPVPQKNSNGLLITLLALLILSLSGLGVLIYKQSQTIPIAGLNKERIIYQHIYLEQTEDKWLDNALVTSQDDTPDQKTVVNLVDDITQHNLSLEHDYPNYGDLLFMTHGSRSHVGYSNIRTQIAPIETVASLDASNLTTSESEETLPTLEGQPSELPDKRKTEYNLSILTVAANDLDFTGYGFGSGVELPIGKRFGFTTGLAFNIISRDFTVFPFINNDDSGNSFKSASEIDLKEQETYYNGLRSFKQVYLPIGLTYKVNEAIAVNSGMRFRYTYSEKIDNILSNSVNRKLPTEDDPSNLFFNNTNIGLTAGFTYSLSDRLRFSLDSEWGLSSILNRTNFDYPSNRPKYDLNLLNLSTSYTF